MIESSFALTRSGFAPAALTMLIVGSALTYAFW